MLRRAWERVRGNKGAAGIDGETLEAIEANGAEKMLTELRGVLETGRYRPQAVRRVHIPKPERPKERRPLGIPRVRDRVVQAAARLVLEPIFEASFLPCSFGFRPKRKAHDACEVIRKEMNRGARWVVDADFADLFGSLDPNFLLRLVARRVSDRRVLRLIRMWLSAGVIGRQVDAPVSNHRAERPPAHLEAAFWGHLKQPARADPGPLYYSDQTRQVIDRTYYNLWVLRFAEDGRCSSFTEWFMLAPAPAGV